MSQQTGRYDEFVNRALKLIIDALQDETYLFQYPGMLMVSGREFLDRRITYRHLATASASAH